MGTNLEQGTVVVAVEEFDVGQTRILVNAKKFAVHNQERSDQVLRQIEADLAQFTRP